MATSTIVYKQFKQFQEEMRSWEKLDSQGKEVISSFVSTVNHLASNKSEGQSKFGKLAICNNIQKITATKRYYQLDKLISYLSSVMESFENRTKSMQTILNTVYSIFCDYEIRGTFKEQRLLEWMETTTALYIRELSRKQRLYENLTYHNNEINNEVREAWLSTSDYSCVNRSYSKILLIIIKLLTSIIHRMLPVSAVNSFN